MWTETPIQTSVHNPLSPANMSPGSWPSDDGAPQSPHPSSPLNDEQMARHLASKYSAMQLSQLFRHVGLPVQSE